MTLEEKLQKIDDLKEILNKYPNSTLNFLDDTFKIDFIYNSNAIEGNTLTKQETKTIYEGISVGNKKLREIFEVSNHKKAIEYVEQLLVEKQDINHYSLCGIHQYILKNIDDDNAGVYRNIEVSISGARHTPPHHFEVQALMQDYFDKYQEKKEKIHPVLLAADAHLEVVRIHPFKDGNGRVSRLLMNYKLLKSGYPAINIKHENALEYYLALDEAHCDKKPGKFYNIIADNVIKELENKIELEKLNSISISREEQILLDFEKELRKNDFLITDPIKANGEFQKCKIMGDKNNEISGLYSLSIKNNSIIGFIKNNKIDKIPRAWQLAQYNKNKTINANKTLKNLTKTIDKERIR